MRTYNSQFVTLPLSEFAEWLIINGEDTSITFLNEGDSVGWLSVNRSNMVLLIITITISSNFIGALTALFFTNHSVGLYSDFVNHSYDYRPNWTPLSPITNINTVDTEWYSEWYTFFLGQSWKEKSLNFYLWGIFSCYSIKCPTCICKVLQHKENNKNDKNQSRKTYQVYFYYIEGYNNRPLK